MAGESSAPQTADELKQQRASTKGSITRIKTLVESKSRELTPTELECRLGILESYFKQALSYQTQIERLQPTDTGRSELEELYVTTKTKIISAMGPGRRNSTLEGSFAVPTPVSRLPFRLPKFNGKYSEFKNFMNCFNNLVDNDHSLSKIEKFNHLLSCLSGQALGTVRAFQVTEENYSKAMDALRTRYDNNCLIFLENISELFELAKVPKGSASHLRNLVDTISALYNSFSSLGTKTDITNAIIIYIAMSKVDADTQAKWDEQLDYSKLPTWTECAAVLSRRCQYLEARESKQIRSEPSQKWSNKSKPQNTNFRSQTSLTATEKTCVFCKDGSHSITTCSSFTKLSVIDRFSSIKQLGLCINCLAKGHTVSKCPSSYRCKTCKQSHHTLLHRIQTQQRNSSCEGEPSSSASVHTALGKKKSKVEAQVILATAVVLVKDSTGGFQLGRALLDSGSQVNFINDSFAQSLHLHRQKKVVDIAGIGVSQTKINYQTHTTIRSRFNNFKVSLEFLIAPSITGYQPDSALNVSDWNLPKNIELADEHFNTPSQIDLLLGAEAFFDLLSVGQIKLGQNLPTLQMSSLGWIVSGRYTALENSKKMCLLNSTEDSLNEYVEKFWQLEEVGCRKAKWTEEQTACEESFNKTIEILPSGRLMVNLPFKSDPGCLGSSYDVAFRRFLSLERRLSKNPSLRFQYIEFLREYESLGHMSVVLKPNLTEPHYYLPHQCVVRPNSTSTKLRVVFDASCCTSSQISLNGILMVGPTIQDELYIILLRFRLHRYALTGDIVKMYRQVLIHPLDRKYQYILWRESEHTPLMTYQLNTITYGTSSAPFLAIRCLQFLSERFVNSHPLGAAALRSDFYVDDLLTGADDLETLTKMQEELIAILQSAGFELSKWHSNSLSTLDKSWCGPKVKDIKLNDAGLTSTLGITWDSYNDNFSFSYKPNRTFNKFTKRSILSLSSSLFDPMGLVSPIIIRAKIILQKLWIEKIDWDAPIPQCIDIEWRQFIQDLNSLQNLSVPRFALAADNRDIQVHGFCDASMDAYGCCIYLRSRNELGHTSVKLLTAKSRVSPAKRKQLPRLELCGAHLLTKLWSKIKSSLNISFSHVYFWTDSEIVLHWIGTHSSKLTTFVGNRIAEIQEKAPEVTWRYISTHDNPADIVSRGCTVNELKSSIWFSGPTFLRDELGEFPSKVLSSLSPEKLALEKRKTVLTCTKQDPNDLLKVIDKFSSHTKLLRVFAYILRFVNRIRNRNPRSSIDLTADEMESALERIVWVIQFHFFRKEIDAVARQQDVKGALKWLSPFIVVKNGFQFLKVGGRLKHANIPENRKHPLLLPKDSNFVRCMVRHLHVVNYHAGPKSLVALKRQQFWVVNARDLARQIVKKCIHCQRYRPKLLEQVMGDLPVHRVTASRPFLSCGVDFWGPIYTYYKIRGKVPYKTYVAVFVCFATKAVHLEAVSDLSSDAFIAALKRMIGRRGLPRDIFCDNATNFVGAQTKLVEFRKFFFQKTTQSIINNFCINHNINFNFIPPRAPHFGGIWEAAVKVAKGHLYRSLCNAKMNFEELTTSLVEIEAIMNSRPITPVSADPNDFEALTPAHFLIGSSLKSIPEAADEASNIGYLQRWRRINVAKTHFWQRWSEEYINELQGRTKWCSVKPNLHVGDMVIIHEDNVPPQRWLLGRVIKIIPGQDEKVRVAEVRTPKGTLRRPIRKLAILSA